MTSADFVHYLRCEGCKRQLRVEGDLAVRCCLTWYGSAGAQVSKLRIGDSIETGSQS